MELIVVAFYFCLLYIFSPSLALADDESWAKYMERGHNFTKAHDLEAAKTEFLQAVEESKGLSTSNLRKADAMADLGKVLIGLHEFSQASQYLEKSAQIDAAIFGVNSKEYAEVLPHLATAQIYIGNGQRGEELSKEASKIDRLRGKNAQYIASELNNRACDFMGIKDWKRAIRLLDEAIEIVPKYGLAYHNRSTAKLRSGDKTGGEADHLKETELEAKKN